VKTISLKKVSAVAVASLGFGLLSVVPAQAADLQMSTSGVASISLAKVTTTPTVGAAVAVNWGADTTAETPGTGDKVKGSITAYLKAFPAGGSVAITPETTLNGDGATASTAIANTTKAVAGASITLISTTAATATFGTDVTASSSAGFGSFKFTPTKAGTYTLEVWNDADQDGVIDATETRQSIDLTVVAASAFSATMSTAYSQGGTATSAPTLATSSVAVNQSSAKGTDNRMSILVVVKDSAGNAMTSGNTLTAEIAGPGFLVWVNEDVDNTSNCTTTPTISATTGRSISTAVDGSSALYVCSDGTSGASTVTLKITDANDVVATLATKSITFFGAVTKIVATGVLTVARAAGASATGLAVADRDLATETPSVIVYATDANNNPVTGLTITAKSSATTVMSETISVAEDIKSTANIYSSGGAGYYNIQTNGSTGSASGNTATLTFRTVNPADTTTFLTSDVKFTIGGSVSTETLAFDKTAYAPGEAMVITRTAKDSAGNPVYDGAASPAVSFSKAVGGTAPAAGVYVGGVSANATSAAKSGVFAPTVAGAFVATATSGATGGATITASSSVTDANAGLLTQIDALNAKIVALNALIAKIMKKLGVK